MGLSADIIPGGQFPTVEPDALLDVASLDQRSPRQGNHPSVYERHDSDQPPAWNLLTEQVDEGFALLFDDLPAAERYVKGKCHPTPLGNVVKVKEDGSLTHRFNPRSAGERR